MPTYQYACTACGHELEAVQKFSDPALTECPACHGRLRKVYSGVGVVFKGSGFYRTDSRTSGSDGGSGANRSEGAGDKAGEKKDSKAAEKKETANSSSATSGSSSAGSSSTSTSSTSTAA